MQKKGQRTRKPSRIKSSTSVCRLNEIFLNPQCLLASLSEKGGNQQIGLLMRKETLITKSTVALKHVFPMPQYCRADRSRPKCWFKDSLNKGEQYNGESITSLAPSPV